MPATCLLALLMALHDTEPYPQCVICLEILSNSKHSMKPSLLKRHFQTNHENYKDKPMDFFKRKETALKSSKGSIN